MVNFFPVYDLSCNHVDCFISETEPNQVVPRCLDSIRNLQKLVFKWHSLLYFWTLPFKKLPSITLDPDLKTFLNLYLENIAFLFREEI